VDGAGGEWECDLELHGDAVSGVGGAVGDGGERDAAGDVGFGVGVDEWVVVFVCGVGDEWGGDGAGVGAVERGDAPGGGGAELRAAGVGAGGVEDVVGGDDGVAGDGG
jgi:hypothetical protein